MATAGCDRSSMQSSIDRGSSDDYNHSCGQCLVDGNNVEAYGFCADCPEYLCVNCFRAHTRIRASRHHKLQEINNIPNEKLVPVASKICMEKCSVHGLEIIKFFCPKHEALCCNDCVVLNHRHCEIDYIPEKCSEIEESAECRETLSKLEKRQKTADNVNVAAKKVEKEIEVNTESVMDAIRMFEQEIIGHIGKLRKKVESEAEAKQRSNKEIVSTVFDSCNKVTSNLLEHQKEILDSKTVNNLAQLFVAVKRAKCALKSDEVNESIKMLGDARTHFQFERNEEIENLATCSDYLGTLRDTGQIHRDSIISRSMRKDRHLMCLAISIGSSHMTVGLSTVLEKKEIFYEISFKEPTSLLINPDGQTVCAYGYQAEQKYQELVEAEEAANYFYYNGRYIRDIYGDMDKRIACVHNVSGKELPSVFVLSSLIRTLKDEAVSCIQKQVNIIWESDIHFVITVPERYERASEVMEAAAEQSGIDSKSLTIVFETEAAFMFIEDSESYEHGDSPVKHCQDGGRYLVLDARDKTFTTTVYELCNKRSTQIYHEVIEFNRGDIFREELGKFLLNLLGQTIVQKYRETYPEEYSDLMMDIGVKLKQGYGDEDVTWLEFYFLHEIVQECTGGTLKDLISKQSIHGNVVLSVSINKIKLTLRTLKTFFQRSVSTITSQLHTLLQDKSGLGCGVIVIIGSFAEYSFLQNSLKKEFPDLHVVVPKFPETAVLLGAVALGHYLAS